MHKGQNTTVVMRCISLNISKYKHNLLHRKKNTLRSVWLPAACCCCLKFARKTLPFPQSLAHYLLHSSKALKSARCKQAVQSNQSCKLQLLHTHSETVHAACYSNRKYRQLSSGAFRPSICCLLLSHMASLI